AAAVATRLLGRPVKYIATRMESFVSDAHAREFSVQAAITLTQNGTLAGMEADFSNPIGAYSIYPRSSVGDSVHAATQLGAPYRLERLSTRARTYWQNKTPSGAIRGVGQPVPCTVTEQLMDRAARHLGEDPAVFRRRHYLAADAFPLTTLGGVFMERLSLTECLDMLLEKMDYATLRKEQSRLRKQGVLRGIGIATFIEQTAVGPGLYGAAGVPATSIEEARLRLEADGCVRVETGATDQGQGTLTGIRQIVAGLLDIDLSSVEVTASDSSGARGGGAWASRGLSLAGEAAALAAQTLRANILKAAGQLLQLDPGKLRLERGAVRGPAGEGMSLTDLAQKAWYGPHEFPENTVELFSVSRSYILQGRPHLMANGVQASLVDVDPETGAVTPLRHWIVEDCGHIVNPALVDGQLMGGAAQGIGGALREACIYDETGQLLTASFLDYAVPRADNVPPFEIHHVCTPQVGTELGIKGVGEAGTVGAPAAVWGAVNDAIAHLGAEVNCQPITSAAVFHALAAAAARPA
ncbi:MAG: molybdopterin-dependent oxidoreductase, partial [Hyphomicrobiales bacterium]|nr:molybdopterin-dependent oxidoreductase [Hyphomicrobiales bacterium]